MLIELLNHRRAVRHYSEQPIDADTVRAVRLPARMSESSTEMALSIESGVRFSVT